MKRQRDGTDRNTTPYALLVAFSHRAVGDCISSGKKTFVLDNIQKFSNLTTYNFLVKWVNQFFPIDRI